MGTQGAASTTTPAGTSARRGRRPAPRTGYRGVVRGVIAADPPLDRASLAAARVALAQPRGGRAPTVPAGRNAWRLGRAGARVDGWSSLGALPEWLVVVREAVLATCGSTLVGVADVQGEVAGDRWTVFADDRGVTVERLALPCPPCWTDVLGAVVPSAAYRFRHPVPEANLAAADERFRPPAWDEERGRWEVACEDGGWTPLCRRVAVSWPRPAGDDPAEPWWLHAP